MRELVELRKVSAGYGDSVILRDVDFKISDGDFIGVIGPNGGGKTTLIKTILGILPKISGEIVTAPGLKIGYLPQQATIDRTFPISVVDVVCSGDASAKLDRVNASMILHEMSIGHLEKKQIRELSGGELQRVLLARAMARQPELLVLDEPTTYVDNKFEHYMYDILHRINNKTAILMVSHDLGMISRHVKGIACVNHSLHYHNSNVITPHQLELYDCPMQLLEHGRVPHTVLEMHD